MTGAVTTSALGPERIAGRVSACSAPGCRQPIEPGMLITKPPGRAWRHANCTDPHRGQGSLPYAELERLMRARSPIRPLPVTPGTSPDGHPPQPDQEPASTSRRRQTRHHPAEQPVTDDLIRLSPPLPTGARPGHPGDGDCPICGHQISRGDRVATLLPDGNVAHVPCIAAAARYST